MYSITITCPNLGTLVALAKVIEENGLNSTAFENDMSAADAIEANQTKPKATRAPRAAKAEKVEAEAPAKSEEPATPPAKQYSADEKAKLYEPVKAATLALSKAKGRDVALRVLSTFNVNAAPELAIDQYDDYVAAAEEELMV